MGDDESEGTMSDQLEIRPASRSSVKPMIALFGESGSGKTLSALYLARGIVGPSGRIAMIETESGRGEFFADMIPGGYDVLPITEPFAPSRCIEAIQAVEKAGHEVLILDSGSHFWEGIGGVLDMAAHNEEAGKKGLAVWRLPKMEHAKMMLKFMQTRLTIIVCLRAKYKSRQVKNGGKSEIVKDDYLTPLQADDFIFESTTHMQVNMNHSIFVTKNGRPDLRACFPEDNTTPITIETGEAIARWAANPGKAGGPQMKAAPSGRDALKRALCAAVMERAGKKPSEVEAWLWEEGLLDGEHERLAEISDARMQEITNKVSGKQEGALL